MLTVVGLLARQRVDRAFEFAFEQAGAQGFGIGVG
jgi:hypothetical protein